MLLEEKLPSYLTLIEAVPPLCSIVYFGEGKPSLKTVYYCVKGNPH